MKSNLMSEAVLLSSLKAFPKVTFEEEEEIDIKAVMAEIKELEAKRAELDAQIDAYLKELGII